MLKLRSGAPSPFGRKVKIAAALLGIEIEVIATDTNNPDDPLRKDNPLGKIPALIREDGRCVYDSRVILEFLDLQAGGGKIIPQEPEARIAALTLQALADGIMDAALLQVYEGRWRAPEHHDRKWLDHHAGKVDRGLAVLEGSPPALPKDAKGPRCRTYRRGMRARLYGPALQRNLARGPSPSWSPGSTPSRR